MRIPILPSTGAAQAASLLLRRRSKKFGQGLPAHWLVLFSHPLRLLVRMFLEGFDFIARKAGLVSPTAAHGHHAS